MVTAWIASACSLGVVLGVVLGWVRNNEHRLTKVEELTVNNANDIAELKKSAGHDGRLFGERIASLEAISKHHQRRGMDVD